MKKIRCALYDRVSTDLQVEEGISLDAQKDALTRYALEHGYEVVGYYSDEGITARKKMQNRKELLRLLEDVKRDKIDLILVTKLDRWFRNIKDYHNTQAILEAHNCNWKTIFEDYDTSTSNGRFAINIMLSVNENECDRDSERIKAVFEYKKRNRELLTGVPTYGYKLDENKRLVKDPETSPIVEDIISYYFTCFSKRKTVLHIQQKYGEKAPTAYKINRIFEVRTYIGEMYGIPDYCEPYLTKSQFATIHSVSDSKTYAFTNEVYIFSQLLRCPVCGCSMTGFTKRQKLSNGSVSQYKRYRCGKKFQDKHGSPCITESVVEEYMLANVTNTLEQHIFTIKKSQAAKKNVVDNTLKYKAELDRLNQMYQKGRISDEYYDTQYTLTERKLKEEQALHNDSNLISLEEYRKTFQSGWRTLYDKLDMEHKRAFWKRLIKAIYFDEKTHKISCSSRDSKPGVKNPQVRIGLITDTYFQ